MTNFRSFALALAPLLALTVSTLPAGSATSANCALLAPTQDAGLRQTMERFDRTQSAAAAKACAMFLNTAAH